jgi:hypothetical protein
MSGKLIKAVIEGTLKGVKLGQSFEHAEVPKILVARVARCERSVSVRRWITAFT